MVSVLSNAPCLLKEIDEAGQVLIRVIEHGRIGRLQARKDALLVSTVTEPRLDVIIVWRQTCRRRHNPSSLLTGNTPIALNAPTLVERLLDRSSKGVVVTPYGRALLARGRAAFDELRQGIKDIEFIADPLAGELRTGCPESIAAGFLLPVLERLTSDYPRINFDVQQVQQPTVEVPELHERKVDLVLARLENNLDMVGRARGRSFQEAWFEGAQICDINLLNSAAQ